ncbi:unnamed protein product [Trifolium pratense]|uniref:Uncharacterized protein n=1 Tax=Trifolium pratense TaxID=57577 RepID=A0ACB0L2W7_TRIPR|nr:unnamed protein product [Trifolium pratense]
MSEVQIFFVVKLDNIIIGRQNALKEDLPAGEKFRRGGGVPAERILVAVTRRCLATAAVLGDGGDDFSFFPLAPWKDKAPPELHLPPS